MEEETCEYTGMDIYNCTHIIERDANLMGADTQLRKYKENIYELKTRLQAMEKELEAARKLIIKVKNLQDQGYYLKPCEELKWAIETYDKAVKEG